VIAFSALLSAMMIRTIDNGHKINAYMQFIILRKIRGESLAIQGGDEADQ